LSVPPEVSIARRLVALRNLSPPIDILALAGEYAAVEQLEFPAELDLDGVCLNVKISGRRKIIVNIAHRAATRIRFTLAHELGHVLIPWHTGSIVDDINVPAGDASAEYWRMESEANRFASELLMPAGWIGEIARSSGSPAERTRWVSREADVSYLAAAIRLTAFLPSGYVCAITNDHGQVVSTSRSPGTSAIAPRRSEYITEPNQRYSWATGFCSETRGNRTYLWWYYESRSQLAEVSGSDDWRAQLDNLVGQLSLGDAEARKLKSSISAIIAHANGSPREDRSAEAVYDACLQRFDSLGRTNPYILALMRMPGFKPFVSLKVQDLAARR